MARSPRAAAWFLASSAWLLALPAVAGQLVRFEDGRELEVERVERVGATVTLSFAGGGAMAVPASRVAGWRPFERAAAPAEESAARPPDAWRSLAGRYAEVIDRAARDYRVDPILLAAVARTESSFDPLAVSPKGASGLMQLMPQTATRFGVTDVFDVTQNVDAAARYLRWLLERFAGRTDLALAGYNAGEGAVDRFAGIPPFPETQDYVRQVLHEVERLGRLD